MAFDFAAKLLLFSDICKTFHRKIKFMCIFFAGKACYSHEIFSFLFCLPYFSKTSGKKLYYIFIYNIVLIRRKIL